MKKHALRGLLGILAALMLLLAGRGINVPVPGQVAVPPAATQPVSAVTQAPAAITEPQAIADYLFR